MLWTRLSPLGMMHLVHVFWALLRFVCLSSPLLTRMLLPQEPSFRFIFLCVYEAPLSPVLDSLHPTEYGAGNYEERQAGHY